MMRNQGDLKQLPAEDETFPVTVNNVYAGNHIAHPSNRSYDYRLLSYPAQQTRENLTKYGFVINYCV